VGYTLAKNKGTKRAPHTQPGEVVYVSDCRSFEAKLQRLGSCGLPQCPSAAAAAILQGIGTAKLFFIFGFFGYICI